MQRDQVAYLSLVSAILRGHHGPMSWSAFFLGRPATARGCGTASRRNVPVGGANDLIALLNNILPIRRIY